MGRSVALVAVVLLVGGVLAWCLLRPATAAAPSRPSTATGPGAPVLPIPTASNGPNAVFDRLIMAKEKTLNDWQSLMRRPA